MICRKTRAKPLLPMARQAASDRSMVRWVQAAGPRSLMRTFTQRGVFAAATPLPRRDRLQTRTRVPNGQERCAAVSCQGLYETPVAVRHWRCSRP